MINNIENLLSFIWDNKFSDFYRKKYKNAGFDKKDVLNLRNFDKLPFLTRQELETILPGQKLFINSCNIQFAAYTSGTSSGHPLITYFNKIKDYYFDPTLGLGVKRLLIVHPPLNKHFAHTFIQQCIQSKNKSFPVFADLQNLANSAVIANQIQCDAIYTTPTIAYLMAEYIEKYYDLKKIKLLALSSETLTLNRRQQLEDIYPNAKIVNLYGSSEIGQFILYPCRNIIDKRKDWFHILQPPVIKAEIIDNELILTYANNLAMPLIRYKTGDYFEVVAEKCECGINGPILSWMGRNKVDKIRISGVEIRVDDVEKVFSQINHIIGDYYQLHFYEKNDGSDVKIKIKIEIITDKMPARFLPREFVRENIINHLMNNWQLSDKSKLKDVVAKNLFLIPEVKFVSDFSYKSDKIRRIVSHINA